MRARGSTYCGPASPSRFGCAIDAALAADHVALGVIQARTATLVIETRAEIS